MIKQETMRLNEACATNGNSRTSAKDDMKYEGQYISKYTLLPNGKVSIYCYLNPVSYSWYRNMPPPHRVCKGLTVACIQQHSSTNLRAQVFRRGSEHFCFNPFPTQPPTVFPLLFLRGLNRMQQKGSGEVPTLQGLWFIGCMPVSPT